MTPVISVPEQLLLVLLVPGVFAAAALVVFALRRFTSPGAPAWVAGARACTLPAAELEEAFDACSEGGDLYAAKVYGDSVPEIRKAALATARELYGEKACLYVEHVGTVHDSAPGRREPFYAVVTVRCQNYAELPL